MCAAAAKLLQLCPTLCDPTDGSPPGSPVLGILQARVLEWVATGAGKTGIYRAGWHSVDSDNQRTVVLISHASSVMLKILQARLQQYVNHEVPDVPHPVDHGKNKSSRETSISILLTM